MYLRAFRTSKSVVMFSCISEQSKLQVSSYVLMYLRGVRTYKSVVIHSCISEHSELTSQWVCTHVSLSIQNLQVVEEIFAIFANLDFARNFPPAKIKSTANGISRNFPPAKFSSREIFLPAKIKF